MSWNYLCPKWWGLKLIRQLIRLYDEPSLIKTIFSFEILTKCEQCVTRLARVLQAWLEQELQMYTLDDKTHIFSLVGLALRNFVKNYIAVQQDQFQRLLPTFIQVIDLTEQEETEYWDVMSAVFEGKQIASVTSDTSCFERPSLDSVTSTSVDTGINNKVHLLRTMLQWEEQLRSETGLRQPNHNVKRFRNLNSLSLGEVVIVCWPHGEIMRLRTGSTAADAARRVGLEGKLVSINGQLVLPNTELKDGDVVEVRV
ncbi:unnamed protein product [Ilex paraguariensis]|uniref:TGS domain-containing protein n=1 Tax=Ilex paraguariensis TaxID=185542 RepID=A0ABC8TSM9_9AQUA